jgi:hypothetical protein
MKQLSLLIFSLLLAGTLAAQEPTAARLQRTPEEEAVKQTERLVRELHIVDSVRIDTLYRMHLKYAILRRTGLSRAQEMERMNAIVAELKNLLTPQEFERFMNHPAEEPRRPRGANVLAPGKPQQRAEHL